jgi:RNA polymerase sigma factor (sigma-70 family)
MLRGRIETGPPRQAVDEGQKPEGRLTKESQSGQSHSGPFDPCLCVAEMNCAGYAPDRVVYQAMTPRYLGELIDRLGPALVLFARQWSATPEDVVQDAFLKLVDARRPPDDPTAWLFAVVRNRAMDTAKADRRRAKREQAAWTGRWFVDSEIDGLDADRAVAALERLPAELRETIVARLWGGLTFQQIAAVAGCSASSAFRRFEAGVAALRETFGVPCPTNPTP